VLFQTVFFYLVGSQQLGKIVENKVDIVNEYLRLNNDHKHEIKKLINTNNIQNMLNKANEEEKERNLKNIEVIKNWIGPPLIIILTLIFICIIILSVSTNQWTGVDSVGLTLVITAYVTEIIIFLGIIKRYEFLGDQPLYYFVYNLLKKQVKNMSEKEDKQKNKNN
jgi:hypothetical protein